MKTIKLKLIIIYLALVFIVMIVSGTFMLVRTYIIQEREAEEALRAFANSVYHRVILASSDPSEFKDALVALYPQGGMVNISDTQQDEAVRITSAMQSNILDTSGTAIASSTFNEGSKFSNSAIIAALAGNDSFITSSDTDRETFLFKQWMNYTFPVKDQGGNVEYVIFVRTSTENIARTLFQLGTTLVFALFLALLLTAILGLLFSNTLTVPIITLTKKMEQGNLSQEIPVKSKDEIGQLTESFNNMAKKLNHSMSTMVSDKNKLEVLLHNMTDGVLAYDVNGVLVHANSLCQELLRLDDIGVKQIEKVTFPEMMKLLNSDITDIHLLSPDMILESTMSSGDKFLGVSLNTYGNKYGIVEGMVVVLQDITKHKKLDNMRKEFVANVSHEIRTPLTTIKSYIETLLNGAMEDAEIAKEFLSIVDSETDRMTFLVQDLLELSKFDNNQFNLNLEMIDLNEMISQVIKQNSILAKNRYQEIIFDKPTRTYLIEVDASRINQVLGNVLGNAIKYSYDFGVIEIYTEETEKYYRVFVKDYGMGIPKEDLWRIFERFYRVDKARSRAMGGTGLGLAISKEIMEAHGGKIMATSETGKGSTFILRFDKYIR